MRSLELSPEEFQQVVSKITSLAQRWLAELDARAIAPKVRGAEVSAAVGGSLPERGEGLAALDGLEPLLDGSRAQNGRFLAYVLGSGEPVAAAADLLASVLNQNVTAWRSGPAAITIEKTVVSSLAAAIGCAGFTGSLTGGGSAANLMALAMAREANAPANEEGARGDAVIYASREVHMSIPKAVALLGLGRRQLRLLPVDEGFRLRPEVLEAAIVEDFREGRRPIAVVATAGTVNTGSIDPLEPLADVANRHGLWFHVDGAYGALAALAVPDKLRGLGRADSLSLDAHKWLYQPLDCGVLLYRDAAAARRAFSFSGDYVKSLAEDPLERFAFFEESAELSRRFRALKLWLSLRFHGLAAFRDAVARDLHHARLLAERVNAAPDLELLAPVELSAVCFRSTHANAAADPDGFNARLLNAVNARGRVYLSNATIRGAFALRACFTNHRTTDEDVEAVVEEVRAAAEALR